MIERTLPHVSPRASIAYIRAGARSGRCAHWRASSQPPPGRPLTAQCFHRSSSNRHTAAQPARASAAARLASAAASTTCVWARRPQSAFRPGTGGLGGQAHLAEFPQGVVAQAAGSAVGGHERLPKHPVARRRGPR